MSPVHRALAASMLIMFGLLPTAPVGAKQAVHVHVTAQLYVMGTPSSPSYYVYMRATLSRKVSNSKAKAIEAQYRPRGKTRFKLGKRTYPGGHFPKGDYVDSGHFIVWYGSTVKKNMFKQIGKKGSLRFHDRRGKHRLRVPVQQIPEG